ncbi:MAG: hypothetical protein ABJD24_07065 [Acidimicrobiales bacterium]
MMRTNIAPNPAIVAGAARPCAFSAGYAWRSDSVSLMGAKQDHTMTAPARRPREIPT